MAPTENVIFVIEWHFKDSGNPTKDVIYSNKFILLKIIETFERVGNGAVAVHC